MAPREERRPRARGFTLIELVIVCMVLGILVSLTMPRYRESELKAQGADVATRVEAINVALKEYEADHDSVPSGTGPSGSPPAWLASYLTRNHFMGPAGINWQFAKASALTRATLVINAGTPDEEQILLAAAAALGNICVTLGGGSSLLVTLSE